jgi:multidrug resistance efflux pump
MSEERDYEIRSDEVNDILSKTPSWMVRTGSLMMVAVLSLIVVGSAFFSYPDIISAPVIITSANLPANLIAKRSGRIQSIVAVDGTCIEKGVVIAMLENPASYRDYLQAKEICSQWSDSTTLLTEKLLLGDLQDPYNQLVKAFKEYREFLSIDYHRRMIGSVKRETEAKRGQIKSSQRREITAMEQFEIAESTFKRESTLYQQRAISLQEYEKSRSAFLSVKQLLEGIRDEVGRNRIEVIKGEQTILNLEMEREELLNAHLRAVESSLSTFMSRLSEWEQTHLFISPVDGMLTFTRYWQENQNVTAGDVVFTVIPLEEKRITGKLYIPTSGAGKVKPGQKINIKLDGYPFMEYGMVEVHVKSVSLLPASIGSERVYIVETEFPDGLRTNYSVDIDFAGEMHGTGEIITERASLLRRVFYPVKHIMNNNF